MRVRASVVLRTSRSDLIDEHYTPGHLSNGIKRMTVWLRNQGHAVNLKEMFRRMRLMGTEAFYPSRRCWSN